MAIVRNTTPSLRHIAGIPLPPRKDVEVPDDVIEKYKASGAGRRRLFDSGMLHIKGAGRVVRMESADTNVPPDDAGVVATPKGRKAKQGNKDSK